MPTYVYRRPDGTTFEVFQKISDDPLTEDPDTGAPVRRVISGGAGLQFKGDGFYLTDYARKGRGGAETSKSEDAKGSGAKESAPAEPKASTPKAESAPSGD